ncbi:amino acid adenylation domain-containing protein [Streptomyces sp. NPDC001315]|uniref:amino acid adenylation domain-containing protein n=1 Tax=Streptomyces sp. NPDC001315 TaxID=3364562 RepID=UPI0036A183CA
MTVSDQTPRCVHVLVAEQAARTPDVTAVSYGSHTLTYRQLDSAADRLAHRLRSAGVGGGSVVAVVMDRSADLVVVLLGILKAGGAYLYLDPAEPDGQRVRILGDSAARFAVVDDTTRHKVPGVAHVVCLDDDHEPPTAPLAVETNPDTPAYVCYTSGSTGSPKGVVVPHRGIHRLVHDPWWIDCREDDVFLQLTRVGFDLSTFEIWMPLVRGCRLAVAPPGHADLAEIMKTVRSEAVTVLWLTSGLFHKLVAHHLDGFGTLRHVLAGGDVVFPDHVRQLLDAHPHLTFTNGYGPTENTTFTTCWTSRTSSPASRVPIGKPLDGTTVAILDDGMRPVTPGEFGELWTGGEGLATGYLHQPAATAEKFVADPYGTEPGSRMYRTGDIARQLPDGSLDFLGRADRQVKIRGFRVEPGTVEMELLRQPGVEQAAALAHADDDGDARLIAYVAVGTMDKSRWPAFGAALREKLAETLPGHLVPWTITVLPDIPLNGNGKVDRSTLPAAKVPRNVWNDYVEPADDLERRLAALWSDALDIEAVGAEDNFFELGGHSLMATDLLAVLREEFGVDIPARTLYTRPTVAGLAEALRETAPL